MNDEYKRYQEAKQTQEAAERALARANYEAEQAYWQWMRSPEQKAIGRASMERDTELPDD